MSDYTPEQILRDVTTLSECFVEPEAIEHYYRPAIRRLLSLAERVAKAPSHEAWFPVGPSETGWLNVAVPREFFGQRIALVLLTEEGI